MTDADTIKRQYDLVRQQSALMDFLDKEAQREKNRRLSAFLNALAGLNDRGASTANAEHLGRLCDDYASSRKQAEGGVRW